MVQYEICHMFVIITFLLRKSMSVSNLMCFSITDHLSDPLNLLRGILTIISIYNVGWISVLLNYRWVYYPLLKLHHRHLLPKILMEETKKLKAPT